MIDIIILPVRNQTPTVMQLYDQLSKQRQELMTITVLDNNSTDGLSNNNFHDIDFYAKSNKPIKNTSSFVHTAIEHQKHDPNDYILFLQPNTILPENYIQNLLDFIYEGTDYVIDVVLGAVNYQKARSTLQIPDRRTKIYKKALEEDETRNNPETVDITSVSIKKQDSSSNEKNFGNPEPDPKKVSKNVFETTEDKEHSSPNTINKDKVNVNWSGIDLNIAYKSNYVDKTVLKTDSSQNIGGETDYYLSLTTKKDSAQNVKEPIVPGLTTPLNSNSISRSQKYDVSKSTHVTKKTQFNWKNHFVPNNVLFRRQLLLECDVYDTKTPFLNWVCVILQHINKLSRIDVNFDPSWPVINKSDKIYNVDKIIRSVNKDTVIEGAKTDREEKKVSEKSNDRIIPDSQTHVQPTSTGARISKLPATLSQDTSKLSEEITITSGQVQQYIPVIQDEKSSRRRVDGPQWLSWME